MSKKPYWWPELTDAAWLARIRGDYEEAADMSDDEIRDYYAEGCKYADTWDHVGDARGDWEKLADAFFARDAAIRTVVERARRSCNHRCAIHGDRVMHDVTCPMKWIVELLPLVEDET